MVIGHHNRLSGRAVFLGCSESRSAFEEGPSSRGLNFRPMCRAHEVIGGPLHLASNGRAVIQPASAQISLQTFSSLHRAMIPAAVGWRLHRSSM